MNPWEYTWIDDFLLKSMWNSILTVAHLVKISPHLSPLLGVLRIGALKFSDAKAQKLLETVGIDATSMSFKDEVINGRSTLGVEKQKKKREIFGREEMWEDSPPKKMLNM